VKKTEARNERAGWAARTPDIESEERNAEIGITVMLSENQVAPEKRMNRENITNSGDGDGDGDGEKDRESKGSHKSGERTTTGIW
jgi:hypothetical protein